jgi:uncharacterized damage-inducible protein DinB
MFRGTASHPSLHHPGSASFFRTDLLFWESRISFANLRIKSKKTKRMKSTAQIAHRIREIILDGDWVAGTNFKAQLSDVSWKQATHKIGDFNTLAALTFHVGYYIGGIVNVLEGGSLDIRDKYSFDLPPIQSQEDWEKLRNKMWSDAERFAELVEQMPDEKLNEVFVDEKYGVYRRNLDSMIEHSYYHLGQIVLIKKMVLAAEGAR